MVSRDMRISLPAGDAGSERNVERRFRRRGFLFGLFAAPLVPTTVHQGVDDAAPLFDQLLTFPIGAWPEAWRSVARSTADLPHLLSGAAPVGKPFPIPTGEPGWRVWVDDNNVEILRVNYEVATTPADSSECDLAAPCVAGCAREVL